jgi:hypothetical protein
MVDLFNRWEQVWHEGKFDLVRGCVAETYIRRDQKGDPHGNTGGLCGRNRREAAAEDGAK